MTATLVLALALLGQAAPVEPLSAPEWGWTVPKDGHAPAGWYRLRRDAAGRYHVFAKDQPSGRFEPSVRPSVNFGVDVSHRTDHGSADVRGTDKEMGRELSRSKVPHGQAVKPAPAGPCPGPGPCPSPKRPEPKPLPALPVAPGLNFVVLAAAVGLLAAAGLVGFVALMIFLLYRVNR